MQAFEQGAVDHLVKPIDPDRLALTVQRLQQQAPPRQHLQWIRASMGQSMRLIPVDEVVYLRSAEKYTLVAWPGGEALIRKTIRGLADDLDPARSV